MNVMSLGLDMAPIRIVDDAEGGIRYWPALVEPHCADAWFHALREGVAWQTEQRPMYDRTVDVPRLLASVDLSHANAPLALHQALAAIQREVPASFSHVGLNLYRDGGDSVAMHGDRVHALAPGAPIAILSLGAPRDMLIRRKARGGLAQRVSLESGSLLVMSHASQFTHEHGIPKTLRPVGARISCAFRLRSQAGR